MILYLSINYCTYMIILNVLTDGDCSHNFIHSNL